MESGNTYLFDSSTQTILDEIYVVGLEYITDIVFFDNESKLLIAAQVEDTSGTNGSLHLSISMILLPPN